MARLSLVFLLLAVAAAATFDLKRPPESPSWPAGVAPMPTMGGITTVSNVPLSVRLTDDEMAVLKDLSFGDKVDVILTRSGSNEKPVTVRNVPLVNMNRHTNPDGTSFPFVTVALTHAQATLITRSARVQGVRATVVKTATVEL